MLALSETVEWLRDLGLTLVLLASVVAAIGALARAPLVGGVLRWLWRHNIADPIERRISGILDDRDQVKLDQIDHLLDGRLAPIRHELEFNGGSTVKDALHQIQREVKSVLAETRVGFAEARKERASLADRIDHIEHNEEHR